MIARLITEGLLESESIWKYLSPLQPEILKLIENERSKKLEKLSINMVSLEEKMNEENEDYESWKNSCQLYCILLALIKDGNLEEFERLLIHSIQKDLDPLCYQPIFDCYIEKLNQFIDPLYSKVHEYKFKLKYKFQETENSIKDMNQITTLLFEKMEILGVYISQDCLFFTKICRIFHYWFKKHQDSSSSYIESVLINSLLPALSMTDNKPSLSNEIWPIVEMLPYETRFQIYEKWYKLYKTDVYLKDVFSKVTKQTNGILKRLINLNVKEMALKTAKISHSNPFIVIQSIISRGMSYNNMIEVGTDIFKHFTKLSFDVVSFVFIYENHNKKELLRDDGTTYFKWFENLSEIVGLCYKKYPYINIYPMLDYIISTLKSDNVHNLIYLLKIINKMSGLELLDDLDKVDDYQIEARGGGPVLKFECASVGIPISQRNTAERLKNLLLSSNDNKTMFKKEYLLHFIVLISQQLKNMEAFTEYTKIFSNFYDQNFRILSTLLEFMSLTMSKKEFASCVPSLSDLVNKYGLEAPKALTIIRPVISHYYQDSLFKNIDFDTSKEHLDDAFKSIYPKETITSITPTFIKIFWSLSLYDIDYNSTAYAKEILKIKNEINQYEKRSESNNNNDNNAPTIDIKQRTETLEILRKEQSEHSEHFEKIKTNLESLKQELVSQSKILKGNLASEMFLQTCIYPRCVLSSKDALFCSKFVQVVTKFNISQFSPTIFYDKIFR